jgi:hypothetical protein
MNDVLIRELQRGRTAFANSADAEAIVYNDYSDGASQKDTDFFWRVVAKNKWGKGSNTDTPVLTEEEKHFLLQQEQRSIRRGMRRNTHRGAGLAATYRSTK